MLDDIHISCISELKGRGGSTKTLIDHLSNTIFSPTLRRNFDHVYDEADNETLKADGITIVLTASNIEMSDFDLNPFIAFAGGFPDILVQKKLYPMLPSNMDGTAKFAPYGLRKVESQLIDRFGKENVVVVHPSNLHRFIGPKTRIVGISTMDPLGIGFVSRTYTSILGLNGKPATLVEFEDLLHDPVLRKHGAKIVVGGSGAWQIMDAGLQRSLGIDNVLMGQAEHSMVKVFEKILADEKMDDVITLQTPSDEEILRIKNPSIEGTVEIMRGCGRGCSFCSPTLRHRHSFPLEHILSEVELNARNGSRMILLQTDDLFLYQARPNFIPNKRAITELVQRVGAIEGVEYMQVAHASLAPAAYDRSLVEEIAPILMERSVWTCRGTRCASMEVGIETGSVRLMKEYMRGKMLPYEPEQWQDVVVRSVETMNDNGIYPLATLILGLPGERQEDIQATIDLLERLRGLKIFYVPLLFTSEEESNLKHQKHGYLKDLDELQWDILSSCWKYNIDIWSPEKSKEILLASLISYPFFRLKHGKKVLAPILRISGLEEKLAGRKIGKRCQPEHCSSGPELAHGSGVEK